MNQLENTYSEHWKNLGTILAYQDPNFQFSSNIIITELDDCLIKPLSQNKIYNTLNHFEFEVYEPDLIKKLQKESKDKSIVIISNQINSNKLNIDIIKRKLETINNILKIPLCAFFALRPNCFMKPHTGLWKLLNAYYKTYGQSHIHKAIVVSNEGGMIVERQQRKTKEVIKSIGFSDVDRAFANNINMPFLNIDEYLDDCDTLDFKWDTKIIPPKTREIYVQVINKRENVNIFQELGKFGQCDVYVIMVNGAPRSGKTRFANVIVNKWRSHEFGKNNAIEILSQNYYTEARRYKKFIQLIEDRISVVIDGNCFNDDLRSKYIHFVKNKKIPILFVDINCGFEMSKLFNHVHVEESNDPNVNLYKFRDYNIYRALYKKPSDSQWFKYVLYIPRIEQKDSVMKFRY